VKSPITAWLFLAALSLLISACDSKSTVSGFMNAVIAKQPYSQYLAPLVTPQSPSMTAVTQYEPLSYEIKNASDGAVSVLITFRGAGSNHRDISETHVFHLINGKIAKID